MKHIFFPLLLSFCFFSFSNLAFAETRVANFTTKTDTLKSPNIAQEAERARINSMSTVEETALAGNRKKARGDNAFQALGYMKSVDYYQKIQNKSGVVTNAMMQHLAEAYRLNGETQLAEYWYARYINTATDAATFLHYAQVLQSNNKCEDAARWLQKYAEISGDNAKKVNPCDAVEQLPANRHFKVEPLFDLNSNQLDFSPIPYQNGIVFTSTRPQDQQVVRRDAWTKEAFSSLFFARKMGKDQFRSPVAFAPELNSRFHDGTVTFSNDGNTMIFTRSNPTGKDQKNVVDLKLFITTRTSGGWSTPIELPFNNDDFNTCHPTLSEDGKTLYFASDMPGSFGGMDIYIARIEDGKWSAPINAGPMVNTAQNEVFPYIAADQVLYFASNGHQGLGGLDIFSVEQTVENDIYSWNNRKNLGKRINSSKDDFAYIIEAEGYGGYLTSNRSGGIGKDDIYRWVASEEEIINENILVVDDETDERITAAAVEIVRRKNGVKVGTEDFYSDKNGQFILPTRKVEQYVLTTKKDGYDAKTQEISATALVANEVYEIRLRKRVLTLRGLVKDGVNNSNIAAASVTLLNKCTDKNVTVVSDQAGKFTFNLNCNCDYELLTSKGAYQPGELAFSTAILDCNATKFVDKLVLMTPTPTEKKEVFTKGDVITLDNLYYDFDKFNIRSDAAVELDRVVDLLRRYPSMKLSLRSHTDSRGEAYYNQWLSRKRAERAVEYIIGKGITGDRIIARGFGETLLTNDCANGVECDDILHQANRRTEIKILELKENVEVRYQK